MFKLFSEQIAPLFERLTSFETRFQEITELVRNSGPFRDSAAERQQIDQQIAAFQLARERLLNIDGKVGLATTFDILFYLTGATGLITSLIFSVGIYIYATQHLARNDAAKIFYHELQDLVKWYQRCIQSDIKEIAHNETYIKLLSAIAPFVELDVLELRRLQLHDYADLSPEIANILASSPHRIQFLMPGEAALFVAKEEAAPRHFMDSLAQSFFKNKHLRMFPQFLAEANRACYGYNPSSEEPTISQQRRVK